MSSELQVTPTELMPPTAIEAIQRAEIDVQITTAHKFPRSMQTFKRRAMEMATLDEETAASCLYSRPVGRGKFVEGLSVRTAEIVGACYGNLRVGAMLVEQNERYVTARGFAHDLESNFASSCEVIESTVKTDGTPYDERMRVVIAKACLAKARRDATFQVVPKALCKPIETAARAVALGDATTLASRRDAVMGWIGKLGIDANRVFAAIGVLGADEIGLEQLATLTGLKTAMKEGDVTVDEAFPNVIAGGNIGQKKNPLTINNPAKVADKPLEKPKEVAMPVEQMQARQAEQPAKPLSAMPDAPWDDEASEEQAKAATPTTEAAHEDLDVVKLRNEVTRLAAVDKIAKAQIIIYLQKNQIIAEDQDSFTDIAPEVLQKVVAAWGVIAAEIKEEQ